MTRRPKEDTTIYTVAGCGNRRLYFHCQASFVNYSWKLFIKEKRRVHSIAREMIQNCGRDSGGNCRRKRSPDSAPEFSISTRMPSCFSATQQPIWNESEASSMILTRGPPNDPYITSASYQDSLQWSHQ